MTDCHKDLSAFRTHKYRMKRLEPYFAQMGKDNDHVLVDDNVRDVLLAQGYQTDESPRSIYSVDKLFEALSGYAPRKVPNPRPGVDYQHGIALAYSCFARKSDERELQALPFTPETIVRITSNPTGSAGLTNYGCSKAESQTRALERGLQTLKRRKQPEPCLAFKRTQFNEKTRLVWGYPYSMTVIEGLVAYPLIQLFKRRNTPMAFAIATGALGTKLRVASYHKEWAYSLDMSQFDATISAELIHIAFKILRTWYDGQAVEPVSGKTVDEIFDQIEYYFIHTTIVMPDGNIYIGKDHGVPSGSFFTQMVDSIVNVIIGGTIASRFKLHVAKSDIFVLGDDLMMWSNRKMSLDVIAKYANEQFGIIMHGSEKSAIFHFDEVIHYLGRDWENGLPTLSEDEVLKRMIYPETFRKYPKDAKERERQVHMMLLAYAATYRSAWRIAFSAIDPSVRNIHRGCANSDVNTYLEHGRPVGEANPDALSGLERFRRKYILGKTKGDIPNTALQYWL